MKQGPEGPGFGGASSMRIREGGVRPALACVLFLSALSTGEAHAQAVERNPPPVKRPTAPTGQPPAAPSTLPETGVQGGPLRGLVATSGPDMPVLPPGRSVLVAGEDLRVTPSELEAVLARHAGQPVSSALVIAIQGDVSALYRKKGYPFAAVVTPPQDVGDGVLTVRILEFRIGQVRQETEDAGDDVRSAIRLSPGDAIPLRRLQEDLVWLNRYPYRSVEAIFRPGDATGETDLFLRTRRTRPLTLYAGYGNTGSESTGWNRVFAGIQAGVPGLGDSLAAYQFTLSPEDIGGRAQQGYRSHAFQAASPVGHRAQVDLGVNWIQSRQAVEVFAFEDTLSEASVSYRFALSNLTGSVQAPGDAWLGVEARRQVSVGAFGDVRIASGAFNAYHLVAGYNRTRFDPGSQTELEAVLRLSPGGLDDANSAVRLAAVSQGRATEARYAYATLSLAHARALSGGGVLRALVRAQLATDALPRSELFGLGGPTASRGYTHDDGAADQGVLFQGDLEFPEIPFSDGAFTLQPSLIADGAWGRSKGGGPETGLADLGFGATARVAGRAELQATVAGALLDGPRTRAGDIRAVARFTVRF